MSSKSTTTEISASTTTTGLREEAIDQQDCANYDMNNGDNHQQTSFFDTNNAHIVAGIPALPSAHASTPFHQPPALLNRNEGGVNHTPLPANKRSRKEADLSTEAEETQDDQTGFSSVQYNDNRRSGNNTNSNARSGGNPAQSAGQNQHQTTTTTNYNQNFNRNQNYRQQQHGNGPPHVQQSRQFYPSSRNQSYFQGRNQNYNNYRNNDAQQRYPGYSNRNNYNNGRDDGPRQQIDNNGVTRQAERFAETRYPFSPYILHFTTDVNDKEVIKQLVKHAKDTENFDIRIIAYRKSHTNCLVNECDVLVFVETTETFAFLWAEDKWPERLDNKNYKLRRPSIPPQLSIVIQNVGYDVQIDEFEESVQQLYPEAVKVIRLKNRAQRELKLVKVEFNSVTTRNSLLEQKTINVNYIRYPVVEYLALARVLVCSRCMGIGHFQRNCPQKDQITCKKCGMKYNDDEEHECVDKEKCIHCQQEHWSNASKCPVIKDYRAALTKNLIARRSSAVTGPSYTTNEFPLPRSNITPVASWYKPAQAQVATNDPQPDIMVTLIKHISDEADKTRECHEKFMQEMVKRDEEQKKRIKELEERVAKAETIVMSFQQNQEEYHKSVKNSQSRMLQSQNEDFREVTWLLVNLHNLIVSKDKALLPNIRGVLAKLNQKFCPSDSVPILSLP